MSHAGSYFSTNCAVPVSRGAIAIAVHLVLGLNETRFGLVTIFFIYILCDWKRALIYMKDFTTFTAPFKMYPG
jgi:hypothetical protein